MTAVTSFSLPPQVVLLKEGERHPLLDDVVRLLGVIPDESLVLIPQCSGTATVALHFAIPLSDPHLAARAFLGSLGCLGCIDAIQMAIFSAHQTSPPISRLAAALVERAQLLGLAGTGIVIATGGKIVRRDDWRSGDEHRSRKRIDLFAVAAQVDALLDRHPRAELPASLRSDLDRALRQPGREPIAVSTLAALIVSIQRPEWCSELLRALVERSGYEIDLAVLISFVGLAAECAPGTERAAVLILLAVLRVHEGEQQEALRLARSAVSTDPRRVSARRLLATLEAHERSAEASGLRPIR
ncbi:hypothetical protein [Rathayibacter toxicus]|uniref:hypothetical protein n=1 Tax=Rathayibacter toxicus TaxID=145458 RepID=UPI001C04E825|nr:hypothetical protein [Rathayibacter toxicus]QWL29941.1 hypothetical protein E2R34_03680 [Rathayibacter toxicus]